MGAAGFRQQSTAGVMQTPPPPPLPGPHLSWARLQGASVPLELGAAVKAVHVDHFPRFSVLRLAHDVHTGSDVAHNLEWPDPPYMTLQMVNATQGSL